MPIFHEIPSSYNCYLLPEHIFVIFGKLRFLIFLLRKYEFGSLIVDKSVRIKKY